MLRSDPVLSWTDDHAIPLQLIDHVFVALYGVSILSSSLVSNVNAILSVVSTRGNDTLSGSVFSIVHTSHVPKSIDPAT